MGNLFVMSIFGKMRLQIGVIMLTGVYLGLAYAILIVNCSELQFPPTKGNYVFIAMITLLLLSWIMVVIGAYEESLKIIRYAVLCWTVFMLSWIVLTILNMSIPDTQLCVTRSNTCPSSMWFLRLEGTDNDAGATGIEKPQETTTTMVPTEKLALKSKNKRNDRKVQEYTTKSKSIGSKSVTSTIANKFISRTKQQIPSVKPTVSTMKNTRMVKQMTVSVNDLVIVIKNIDTKNMIVLTFHALLNVYSWYVLISYYNELKCISNYVCNCDCNCV